MAYTAHKTAVVPDADVLRAQIRGWGVDKDPAMRPASKKEVFDPGATGAHWDFPERQTAHYPREKSTEHKFLTPVFGTSCPLRGLSGLVRRYAYTFSEGRMAHWLLLMAGDRIDVVESRVIALLRGRPDFSISEMGLRSELRGHGLRSRIGHHRSDVKHLPVDVLAYVVPRAIIGGLLVWGGYRLLTRRR